MFHAPGTEYSEIASLSNPAGAGEEDNFVSSHLQQSFGGGGFLLIFNLISRQRCGRAFVRVNRLNMLQDGMFLDGLKARIHEILAQSKNIPPLIESCRKVNMVLKDVKNITHTLACSQHCKSGC
jgi:hypothetical protein